MVSPTEHTLVGAGKARSGLHAAVALDPVEGVFVAAATPTQHGFGPPAKFDPGMTPHHTVP